MGEASAVCVCRCGCGLCGEAHFQPEVPSPSYPAQGPNNRTKKTRFQGKESCLFVPVISLLPKPQTPLKSPGPHGCCGGGGDERVLGGAWGCGSALPRADPCGAVPAAMPVRLPVHVGWGAYSTWAVPTPFWFPTAQPTTLSSRSSWLQGPPPDALIGWGRCPVLVNLCRRGRGAGAGLQRAPRHATPLPAPPCPRTPERAPPPGARCERRPGAREGRAPLPYGGSAGFHPAASPTDRDWARRQPAFCVPGEQTPATKLSLRVEKNPQCTPSLLRGPGRGTTLSETGTRG